MVEQGATYAFDRAKISALLCYLCSSISKCLSPSECLEHSFKWMSYLTLLPAYLNGRYKRRENIKNQVFHTLSRLFLAASVRETKVIFK